MTSKLTAALRRLTTPRTHWWLALMLLCLHASTAWGIDVWWSRAFLIAHFGLFLLWQPLWRGEADLDRLQIALILSGGVAFMLWNSWWLLTLWLAALIGLVGGSMLNLRTRRQRIVHLLAVTHLLGLLLVWVVPHLFVDQESYSGVQILVRYGLGALPAAMLFIKIEKRGPEKLHAVDFFYCVMLFLLVVAFVLGSFVIKMTSKGAYPLALAQTLIVIAVIMLALSWLWSPRGGFSGFEHLLSRYVLSVGLPFERWLQNLAAVAERETSPDHFLKLALEDFAELPWMVGGKWKSPGSSGEFGSISKHHAEFNLNGLKLLLYTRTRLSPAFLLHVKLLTELLNYFYQAKRREQALQQNAYTQAVYETGARLTHDVKNMLQSLTALCTAAQHSQSENASSLQALVKRQLPQITERLRGTLEKLHAPHKTQHVMISASVWWDQLKQRYMHEKVEFIDEQVAEIVQIPSELFDSVADNLIQNALKKRNDKNNLRIWIYFSCSLGITLTVLDNGAAVTPAVAERLFDSPVSSSGGLGIGLYQASRQAQQYGYILALASNQDGRVCFKLEEWSRNELTSSL